MKLGGIEYTVHKSEFVPEGKVIIWEQYLNNFVLVSRKELTTDNVLCAISLYLKDAKTRPAYRNLRERLIGEQTLIRWSELEDEAPRFKTNLRLYFPQLFGNSYGY